MSKKGDEFIAGIAVIGAIIYGIGYVLKQLILGIAELVKLFIDHVLQPLLIILGSVAVIFIVYKLYVLYYFNSSKFKQIKNEIQNHIDECNELNDHIEELKHSFLDISSYEYGDSKMHDNSRFNFKREKWQKKFKKDNIHHCSLSVCNNADNQPMKYLCKYFNIEKDETSLSIFESVLNDFAAAEQGKFLLEKERDQILSSLQKSIPWIIFKFNKQRLSEKLGFKKVDLSDLHFPTYSFQYVSPGGNSSARCDIKLNVENLDNLVNYLSDVIKFIKSIQGQRALMTTSLREKIKNRDNFTCLKCLNSIYHEENLLLEIDHIIPLSKGGLTTEHNLQTLCWKCNRTKGAKIESY